MPYLLGLDFGGTKLAAGLVDAASATVIARTRCPTPATGGAEASLAAMLALADQLLASHPASRLHSASLAAVGVSFGGPVAADGRTVRLSMHVPGWSGVALAARLEAHFGVPAVVANDGDAAALAEYRFGAGRGVRHLLYYTVSTGIGGGVIIGGALHRGERAWAGEVGHVVLKPDGPPCPCGRNGCLEALASGLSIAREAGLRGQGSEGRGRLASVLYQMPSDQITAERVAALAQRGDPLAGAVWAEAMVWLGIGIASAANVLNPGRVVLGGGLTRAGALLFAPVRLVVADRALDPALEVVPAALRDDVGILGGAALVLP